MGKRSVPIIAVECFSPYGFPSEDEAREKPFPTPTEINFQAGEGATVEDLRRGYLKPDITNAPEYDKGNYVDRYSQPQVSDNDEGGSPTADDYQFRMKDRNSQGFLTRPRIPTER